MKHLRIPYTEERKDACTLPASSHPPSRRCSTKRNLPSSNDLPSPRKGEWGGRPATQRLAKPSRTDRRGTRKSYHGSQGPALRRTPQLLPRRNQWPGQPPCTPWRCCTPESFPAPRTPRLASAAAQVRAASRDLTADPHASLPGCLRDSLRPRLRATGLTPVTGSQGHFGFQTIHNSYNSTAKVQKVQFKT